MTLGLVSQARSENASEVRSRFGEAGGRRGRGLEMTQGSLAEDSGLRQASYADRVGEAKRPFAIRQTAYEADVSVVADSTGSIDEAYRSCRVPRDGVLGAEKAENATLTAGVCSCAGSSGGAG